MSICGIDFGNLSLLIAQTAKGGVDVILNDASNRQTATCVSVQGKQRFIGDAGAALARTNIKNTVSCMKMLVGRHFDDEDTQVEIKKCPFQCTKLPHGGVGIVVTYNDEQMTIAAEHFMGMMLLKAKDISFKANGNTAIADAVLAVPHWFTDSQRRGVLAAAEIATLPLLKIANEATLIALSYGIYKSAKNLFSTTDPIHIMFIDIGYTGYTVTIVDYVQENLKILSTVCDVNFGGRDIDDAIIEFLCEVFLKKTGIDVRGNTKAILKLQVAAEKAKKTLSPAGVNEAAISVECLAEEKDLSIVLTRDEFEARIAGLVARLEDPVVRCLKEAELNKSDISEIEIVGGSSRVNIIKKRLGEILGLDPSSLNYGLKTTMNADEAVSRGGALQCAIESVRIKVKPFTIVDRVYYSMEARYTDKEKEEVVPLFQRGEEINKKAKRISFSHRTSNFDIQLHYSKSEVFSTKTNTYIGSFTVVLPSDLGSKLMSDGQPANIRVTFSLDKHGCSYISSAQYMQEEIVEAKASEDEKKHEEGAAEGEGKEEGVSKESKKKYKAIELEVVSHHFCLSKDQIKASLELEASMSFEDQLIRETAHHRNELESYIYSMRDKIDSSIAAYSTSDESTKLKEMLVEAEDWLYGDGFDSTKQTYIRKLEELKAISNPIEYRYNDSSNRPSAVDGLRKQIELCRSFASNADESHSHITEDDRNKIKKCAQDCESWLFDLQSKQADVALNQTPVLTCDMIASKRQELFGVSNPIMIRPKPKPKAPEPAKTESKTDEHNHNGEHHDSKAHDHSECKPGDHDHSEGHSASSGHDNHEHSTGGFGGEHHSEGHSAEESNSHHAHDSKGEEPMET